MDRTGIDKTPDPHSTAGIDYVLRAFHVHFVHQIVFIGSNCDQACQMIHQVHAFHRLAQRGRVKDIAFRCLIIKPFQ